ncbi:hypothetical protein ACS0TY_031955 [Phlomoides rotata]
MVAAQLTGGAAVSCGSWNGSRKFDFLATNSKGFRFPHGSRTNFDGVGVFPLSLNRAKLFLPFPVIRQRKKRITVGKKKKLITEDKKRKLKGKRS